MTSVATLTKWGNGAGLLIPKAVRETLGIKVGDSIRFETTTTGQVTLVADKRPWTLHDLMEGYDGATADFIDPGRSFGREEW